MEMTRQQVDDLMREKCQLMQKHNEDLEHRDTEIESTRIASKQKEQEKTVLR